LQLIAKKLQKRVKKSAKKRYNVLKKYIPLHRFNKQMIVLQIKKAKKMKKLVFMFVAMAAISFASCNNANKPAPEQVDSTNVEVVDTTSAAPVDTAAVDTTATAE